MERESEFLERAGSVHIRRVVMGKLRIDVDLLEGIKALVKQEGIRTGVILSGLGALRKAVFRNLKVMPPDYVIENKHRLFLDVEQPMELVSLPGWIATKEDGEIEVHAHFSASMVRGDQIVTLGGHLVPGTLTSIKVVIMIGVIEELQVKAALDPMINQMEIFF